MLRLGCREGAVAEGRRLPFFFADEIEIDRTSREIELLDQSGLKITPVLLREFFLAVTKQLETGACPSASRSRPENVFLPRRAAECARRDTQGAG